MYSGGHYLIFSLSRFKHQNHGYHNTKIDELVDFPIKGLDLRQAMKEQSPDYTKPAKYTYDLIGVINHFGTMDAGHYTAYCLNSETDRWYAFDDS